jgi:hypothetical protein
MALPQLRFCRLGRTHQAQRLIQPSKHESNRTISARRDGVNWKMDRLTRDQTVSAAWQILAEASAAGDAHVPADARAVVPAVDDEVVAFGLQPDGVIDGGA